MRLKPQLIHELASAKNVTSATASRGVRGQPAIARMSAPIGGDVASTWPVMITSDICSVNGIRSQKPRPQASTTCAGVDGVAASAAANTTSVAASAKMKASGTQRSLHAVSASASRATGLIALSTAGGEAGPYGAGDPLDPLTDALLPEARQVVAYVCAAYLSIGFTRRTDVPFIDISSSPLVPGARPVSIHYRDVGNGPPIVVL